MIPRTSMLKLCLLSFGLVVFAGLAVWQLGNKSERAESNTYQTTLALLTLERSIGYVGLIHHFKNAVLRPQEPAYLTLAQASYNEALFELSQLQRLLDSADVAIDVTPFRQTLDQYGLALDHIRAAHENGRPIPEVDALVRVDDRQAQASLVALQSQIKSLLSVRERALKRWLNLSVVALVSFISIAIFGAIRLSRHEARIHAQKEQAQKDLAQEQAHAQDLSTLIAQLENTNREQAEFSYAISHDLKAPANTIGMLLEELAEIQPLGPDGRALLDDMRETNTQMRQLVDDVLDYSRIVGEDLATEPVHMTELLHSIVADLAGDIARSSASIAVPDLPDLTGNRMQLRMLFQNLLSNAIKFRHPEHDLKIEISSQKLDDGTRFTVSDNGIGIPEQYRNRVFGLFQRLNTRSAYEGTGIGLTICQRVMSNHQGTIEIGEGLDGGTSFTMTFPDTMI